jgi:predicted phosphodiesterase
MLMKLLVLADLHLDEISDRDLLDHLGDEIRDAARGVEALIIAGDLAEVAARKWPHALRWLGSLVPAARTVLIPGNHDYYGENLSTVDAELDRICSEAGCRFGQCQRLEIGDVRILMTTLWTDMRLFAAAGDAAVAEALWNARKMPDYGYGSIVIGSPERELKPQDTVRVHQTQLGWLTAELAQPWSGKTVVVTHHAPSGSVAGPITPLSPCFASDLDALIDRYRPDLWVFGHTHRWAEVEMPGGTLLRNVSFGYEHEFRPGDVRARVRRGLIDLDQIRAGR